MTGAEADDGSGGAERDPSVGADAAPVEHLTVTVDPRSGIGIVVGVLALFVASSFVAVTTRSLTVIAVGVLLAFAFDPVIEGVRRRLGCSRGAAVGLVGAVLLCALTALGLVVGPAAVRQATDFGDELPRTLQEIEGLPLVGPRLADADFAERVEEWIDGLPGRLDVEGIESALRSALGGLINGLGALLVAIVVLVDGPRLVSRLRVLVPARHRSTADDVGRAFTRIVGSYFAGSLLVAMIAGTWVLTVGLLVGVPLAPVAAVWYAVVSLLPQVGGFLGTSFVTILALTQGVVPALIVLVLVVGYMNLENYVISPAIVGESVDLSPPVTMLAALVGAAVAGVPGALAATPLCGTVKALYLRARFGQEPPVGKGVRDRLPDRVRRLLPARRADGGGDRR